jgi:acyl-CoA hydrolase
MAETEPIWHNDTEACAEAILSRVGTNIVLGLPLGLGKANSLVNALYSHAESDPAINLQIFTALSLGRPPGASDLERRFLDPLFERLAGNYPELAYNRAAATGRLPPNIAVHEFYFPAGRRLASPQAQQSYTYANYTHAARDLLERGVNVVTQLVARRDDSDRQLLSLSCNPDLTLDLLPVLRQRQQSGQAIAIAGQVNEQLPFMLGPAVVEPGVFDFILDGPDCQFDLFAVPKQPVPLDEYARALHVATLVEDGGTLQIGIGGFSDAIAHALKLRHQQNDKFAALIETLGILLPPGLEPAMSPFEDGLYANSEMLVEGLLELRRAGIVKRRVSMDRSRPAGSTDPMIHSAFFLGSRALYRELRELSDDELADIAMTSVSFVNQLYGDEELKREQRKKARFVNRALAATALGAVTSDGLADGRIVSGVGGQYNFVAQAHELPDARSIISLDAVRTARGRTSSNIVWSHGHTTIPRHLRDIIVTEYGVADLRGKSDRDIVAAMLNITDSRFQDDLLATARRVGKIEGSYRVPDQYRGNLPERIATALAPARRQGLLPQFPLGTEMTPTEARLVGALQELKTIAHSRPRLLAAAVSATFASAPSAAERDCLARLGLEPARSLTERLMRWSVLWGLRHDPDPAAQVD